MIEWDMRQGSAGGPGVAFTASEAKPSSTGASYEGEVLRYLMKVGAWGWHAHALRQQAVVWGAGSVHMGLEALLSRPVALHLLLS